MAARPFALLLLALAAALPAGAQVYKWTGPDGRTHYGDRPPEDAKLKDVRIGLQSHAGPVVVDNWTEEIRRAPPPTQAQPGAFAVTLYVTPWCAPCKRARAHLAQKGVDFREVDVEASEENGTEFREFGGKAVPLILVGEQRMRGFDAGSLDKMLTPGARARP